MKEKRCSTSMAPRAPRRTTPHKQAGKLHAQGWAVRESIPQGMDLRSRGKRHTWRLKHAEKVHDGLFQFFCKIGFGRFPSIDIDRALSPLSDSLVACAQAHQSSLMCAGWQIKRHRCAQGEKRGSASRSTLRSARPPN